MENLVLVDKKDRVIGFESKEKCHRGKGILHRAFTIFIFNSKNRLLLQKRSLAKSLWPDYWEASCSSHPLKGESYEIAGEKRLKRELGIDCRLKFISKFQYQSFFKDIGAENEVCALLVGSYNGQIKPDPKEIADYKWIEIEELKNDIKENPDKYAPWLEIALKEYLIH